MHPWFRTFLAGIGILSDAFNLFSINLVKNVMAIKYPQSQGQTSAISSAALAGAIIGQLTFGSLADRLGRKAIFVSTIAIVIVGALGSATVVESSVINIYTQLTLWLLLLGLGIGGEYPLSASVSSEGGDKTTSRGKSVGATFAMQGVGNLLASLTMFILLSSSLDLDWVWRIALGAGAIPGLLTVYFRYQMEESSHYKKHAASRASSMAPSVAATPRFGATRRPSTQLLLNSSNAVGTGGLYSMSPLPSPGGSEAGALVVPGSARTVHLGGTALDFSSASAEGTGKSSAINIVHPNGSGSGSSADSSSSSGLAHLSSASVASSSSSAASFMMPPPASPSMGKKSVSINNNPVTMTPENGSTSSRSSRVHKASRPSAVKGGAAAAAAAGSAPSRSPVSSSSAGSYVSSGLDLHVADGDSARSSLLANEHSSPASKDKDKDRDSMRESSNDDAGSTAGFSVNGGPPLAASIVPYKSTTINPRPAASRDSANEATPLVAGSAAIVPFSGGDDNGDEGDRQGLITGVDEGGNEVGIDVGQSFTGQEHESLGFCGRMMAPFRQLCATLYEFRWLLLGTAGSWFIFDIVFYANGEFSGSVLQDMGWSKAVNKSAIGGTEHHSNRMLFLSPSTPSADVAAQQHMLGTEAGMQAAKEALAATALGNLILALIGLPGYIVAVAIIDKLGRRNLQLLGFGAVAFIYIILGVALASLIEHAKPALLIFYGLSFFFLNVGPNTSTFVIPAEAFPTRAKATCHGISAASGKLGAVIGAAMMSPLLEWYGNATPEAGQKGLALVLYACAAVSVVGFIWTFFFTQETSKISIEHLDRYGVHSFRMAKNKTKSRLRNRKTGAGGNDGEGEENGLTTLDESNDGSSHNSDCDSPRSVGEPTPPGVPSPLIGKQQKRIGLAGASSAMDIKPAFGGASMSNASHSSRLVVLSADGTAASYTDGMVGASPSSGFDLTAGGATPPTGTGPQLPHVPGMLVSDEERARILGRPWSPGMELKSTTR